MAGQPVGRVAFHVNISGLDDLTKALDRYNNRVKNINISYFGDAIVNKAKAILRRRYKRSRKSLRTGNLEAGIKKSVKGESVTITSTAPYSNIVDTGRGAIEVSPPRFMAFRGDARKGRRIEAGGLVFTQRVGPYEGTRFMAETRAWARKFFPEYVNNGIKRIIETRGRAAMANLSLPATNVNATLLGGESFGVKPPGTVRSISNQRPRQRR